MSLARLFALTTTVLALLVSVMLGRILVVEWQRYRDTEAGLQSMTLAHQAMVAAEKISFERGPANGVLGDGNPPQPAKRERLAAARHATDEALAALHGAVLASHNIEDGQALAAIESTQGALPAARQRVDALAALPRSERTPAHTTAAVNGMIALVPGLMRAVAVLASNATDVYPRFTDTLTAARLAAALREYAGQLGSQFTAALTSQQALSEAELERIHALRGRIDQLHSLIVEHTGEGTESLDPQVANAVRALHTHYFERGLAFVDGVEVASKSGQPYSLDTAEFAARYVPEMAAIIALRDALLAVAIEGARAEHRAARYGLAIAALTGLLALLLLGGLAHFLRRRVLRPLLGTTRALIRLAQGDLATALPTSRRRDEIGDILRALTTLRALSIDKRALEQDHQALIENLKLASSTDELTGLLNRRAFNAAAEARLRQARQAGEAMALVLFDIDHFKLINDQHGHDVGDQVLRRLAEVVKPLLREGECLARYGGEEFIALPQHCELDAVHKVAERMRAGIEAASIELAGGGVLHVTASFGVAAVSGPGLNLASLFTAADQALYRAKQSGRNRVEDASPC